MNAETLFKKRGKKLITPGTRTHIFADSIALKQMSLIIGSSKNSSVIQGGYRKVVLNAH